MIPVTRDMLMAYADGRTDAAQVPAVEAYLAAHPDAAAEVALMQRQSQALRTLFDPVAAEPVPARLRPHRIAAGQARSQARAWRRAAAAIILLALGVGGGWLARAAFDAPSPSGRLIAEAVNAHTVYVGESRHAVEVGGEESTHLSSWLSNRLSTPLPMPDLTAEGFALVGGRLLPGEPGLGGRAAQLMYEDASGERITVYVTPALPDGRPVVQLASLDGAAAFYWANARITCTVVGSLPQPQMQTVSQAVYSQLATGGPGAAPYRG